MLGVQLPRRVAENVDRFTGRRWLLPAVLDWWDRGDSRLFLLTGPPGTGKSMIAAWLAGFGPLPLEADAAAQLTRVRGSVKAAHFCQAASRNTTPPAFAGAVATQLARTVASFGDAVAAILKDRVQIVGRAHADTAEAGSSVTGVRIERIELANLGDEYSFDQAFTAPLKKTYESGYTEPILLIVDALDEAMNYSGVTTVELLSRLDDLPPEVRILVTTRDDPRVLKYFDEVTVVDLIADARSSDEDVRAYAAQRLGTATTLDEHERVKFAERLARQADGVFLYAALVLDELVAALPTLPDLEDLTLPRGLSGLYKRFLLRELGKGTDESRWFETFAPLLGLLAVAQGDGLTARQLAAMTGRSDVRASLRTCKQYLTGELPDGPFKPFHKSFADFLLEEDDNVDFHIDAVTMHRRIVDHYRAGANAAVDSERLDSYALAHYAFHLVSGDRHEELVTLATGSPRWMHTKFEALLTDEPFVADVDLASRHTTDVGQLVNLHAALTVVRLKAAHYSDDELTALSLLGRAQEARSYARLRPEPADKISALAVLAEATDRAELRSALLDEAIDVARAGGLESWKRSTALDSLAVALVHDGRIDRAKELASSPFSIAEALIIRLLGNRQFDEALKTARATTHGDSIFRAKLLALIGRDLSLCGDDKANVVFEEALTTAHTAPSEETQAAALAGVAAALTAVDGERAARIFDEALQRGTAISEEKGLIWRLQGGPHGTRTKTLEDLSVLAARSGSSATAREAAQAILPPMDRFRALCNVAVELAKRDDDTSGTVFAELTALASQLGKEWENRLKELPKELLRFATDNPFETALAEGLTRAGRLTDAEAVARSVSPHVRLEALRRRMVALAQARDTRAAVVLADIVALVQTVDETPVKSLAERLGVGLAKAGYAAEAQRAIVTQKDNHVGIRDVAVAMAGAGYLAEATALAESVDPVLPTVSRELIMYSVATGFARTGQFDQAAEAARGSGMFGDLALADIVEALVKAGHADTAVSIVTGFVRASSRPSSSSMLLRRLATAFENREDDASKSIRDSVMEELKNCVETIPRENEKARVEAGAQLAIAFARLRLPGSDKIFADTIDAARSISNDLDRDQELSALATTWADAGHFDRAREIALSLDGPRRDETVERLSATLADHEQVAEATELAATIEGRDERLEVLADLLARQGRLREALDTLRERDPHHFAVAVAGWAPWLEKYSSAAATTILRDALGILAWANPAYGDIAANVFPPS